MSRYEQDSMDAVTVRNLDQIQERDPDNQAGPSKISALVLASFGGACIVFCALALMRSPASEKPKSSDPLGDLVAATGPAATPKRRKLVAGDVTFPAVLTDDDSPTTSMEVVRGCKAAKGGPAVLQPAAAGLLPDRPPPATDRLVGRAPVKVAPTDSLRTIARQAARETEGGGMVESGRPGAYQLQVSSFKEAADADGFAMALRRRGHKAHVEKAHVKGRGLWHRVRIGPFRYKRSAEIYRQDFEAKERLVTFVVKPPKTRVRISLADD